MHTEVLTTVAVELFPQMSAFAEDFYLAGGTGLALQLGHRISVDFELFSPTPVKRTLLKSVEEAYRGKSRKPLVSNRQELTMTISGVMFTFLHYPFPVILPVNETGPIPILCVKEILATKAYTIGRRGEFKDYFDLYAGLQRGHITLSEILDLANQKYGDAFNGRLFLEQLVYLDDVDATSIIMKSGKLPTKSELIAFFAERIRKEPALHRS
jgi:hypothetical protein